MEFTEEELEAIKLSDEMIEMYKESEERQKQRELERKEKIKSKNFKMRKFKKAVLTSVLALSLTGGALALSGNILTTETEKAVAILENEIGTHGGEIDLSSDKYMYNLNEHLEKNDCELTGDGSIEDRIDNYCERNGISDNISDLAKTKFSLLYENKQKEAKNINLLKEYRKEIKELEEENNAYGMN